MSYAIYSECVDPSRITGFRIWLSTFSHTTFSIPPSANSDSLSHSSTHLAAVRSKELLLCPKNPLDAYSL